MFLNNLILHIVSFFSKLKTKFFNLKAILWLSHYVNIFFNLLKKIFNFFLSWSPHIAMMGFFLMITSNPYYDYAVDSLISWTTFDLDAYKNTCEYPADLFFPLWFTTFSYAHFFVFSFDYFYFYPLYFLNFFEALLFEDLDNNFNNVDTMLTYYSWDFYGDPAAASITTGEWADLVINQIAFLLDYRNYLPFLTKTFFYKTPVFLYTGLLFLFSTILSLVFMSYLGLYGVFILNLMTLFSFWVSVLVYMDFFFYENGFFKIVIGKWFTLYDSLVVNFELYTDSISYSFMLLTATIAMFVYIYVYSYFRYDANVERLILFINCFVISMVLLVVSGNLFVFFLGWELIGLTSFLLINFWSTRISTLKSAFKAYTFNKFSDVSILISCLLSLLLLNDVNIVTFNSQISFYQNYYLVIFGLDISIIEIISFFFISAAFVKSAQFGTHIWLPDSMEAPVPASALIHSATLVSAGVFLLLRFSPLFEISTYAFYIIPFIGSFTAFFGGVCASYQSDIKRILAYSTISHCGFLMVSYSISVPEYTILYLYIHGFFKAAVFLCAGNIIRFSRNYQDFKRMGSFFKFLPFEFFAAFVCLINLCGLPFTIGFYIKHLLVIGLSTNNFLFYFIFVNVIGGAVSGLFYSYKFFFYSFLDVKKSKKSIYDVAVSKNLNSFFYSNTSLAANITITCLIVVSYCISLLLFNYFLNKNSISSGLDILSSYSSLNLELVNSTKSFLENISIFNWLIFLLILSLIFTNWRSDNKSTLSLFTITLSFLLSVFLLFYLIII